jgi:hypothetical protein
MKNVFFALAFMLVGTFAFANNSVKSEFSDNMLYFVAEQNCNEYASNAANEEVGWFENFVTQGQAYINSYNYWLGFCEGASAGGAIVLEPVFIE